MKQLSSIFPILLVFMVPLKAHEHWVFVSPGPYALNQPLSVAIQSGHELGESEFLIDTDLIREAFVLAPSGERTALDIKVQGNEHITSFSPQEIGEHTIQVKLRKRDKGPFSHILMTRFIVGTTNTTPNFGQDPELAIRFNESEKNLHVTFKGETTNIPIELLRSGSMGNSLLRDRRGFSSLENVDPGVYVAVAHYRRQTVSLTFNIEE